MKQEESTFPKKIKIWASFKEAYSFVWTHKKDLLRISFVPIIFYFFSYMLSAPYSPIPDSTHTLLNQGITFSQGCAFIAGSLFSFIAAYMLTVAIFRYIFLGEHTPGKWFQMSWNRRHWRMIGYSILYFLLLGGGIIAYMILRMGIFYLTGADVSSKGLDVLPSASSPASITLYDILGIVPFIYISLRLILYTPAITLDRESPFAVSWKGLKGNMGRFFLFLTIFLFSLLVLFIIPLIFSFLCVFLGTLLSSAFVAYILSPILSAIFTALGLILFFSFQGVVYKLLVGVAPTMRVVPPEK